MFDILNQAYADIYGAAPFSDRQIEHLIKTFISFLDVELINAVEDMEGNPVGFLIALPDLSQAMIKAKGRLFPFGWYHLSRAMKKRESMIFMLIAVTDEYRYSGVPILMLADLAQRAMQLGITQSESSPMLETNTMVQSLNKYFRSEIIKRRRIFI